MKDSLTRINEALSLLRWRDAVLLGVLLGGGWWLSEQSWRIVLGRQLAREAEKVLEGHGG